MPRPVRRTLVTAVVLVLALGACGSASNRASKVSTVQLVAGSADAAAAARTARISGSETITVDGESKTIPIDGAIDFTNGAAEMTIDMGSMGLKGLGAIRARVVDQVMYMDFGEILSGSRAPAALRGKRWLKLDLAAMGGGANSSSNVAGLLESLRGAGDVRTVGPARIDGVDTVHYRANIDTAKALDKVKPGPLRDMAEKGLAMMGASYPVDVWIDDDGLPRRFAMKISMQVDGERVSVSETVNYTDFGTAVHVEAPSAEETADFAELSAFSQDPTSVN